MGWRPKEPIPTPRTDAVAFGVAMYSNDDVKLRDALAHGRDLERELIRLQAFVEECDCYGVEG